MGKVHCGGVRAPAQAQAQAQRMNAAVYSTRVGLLCVIEWLNRITVFRGSGDRCDKWGGRGGLWYCNVFRTVYCI